MTPSTRWSTDTKTHNLCTNTHTHTHTHVYQRIDVQIHTHMHIYTYIHVRTHKHIHIYTHTHTKCTYERTQARLERQRGSERARSRCRERKLCRSLSFDAIKLHFAPPIQILPSHFTHFLKHQYPSTPHPLFPTYPRTVRGLRASELLLFYTDLMNRVHNCDQQITVSHFGEHKRLHLESSKQNYYIISLRAIIKAIFICSEEALRTLTMAPCVVAERMLSCFSEGK